MIVMMMMMVVQIQCTISPIVISATVAHLKTSFDPKRLWIPAQLYMWYAMKLVTLSLDCAVSSLRMGQHQRQI
jgi:hypothetical protein